MKTNLPTQSPPLGIPFTLVIANPFGAFQATNHATRFEAVSHIAEIEALGGEQNKVVSAILIFANGVMEQIRGERVAS